MNVWLDSNLTFHVMRDHPHHRTEILGGMWGGMNRHGDIYRSVLERVIHFRRPEDKVHTYGRVMGGNSLHKTGDKVGKAGS